jgi:hypothetical protein
MTEKNLFVISKSGFLLDKTCQPSTRETRTFPLPLPPGLRLSGGRLEEDDIVVRKIYAEVPPRVEYSLSELGETLRPIIEVMEKWGTAYKARFEET